MTSDLDIWRAGSSWPYLGQILQVNVMGQSTRSYDEKCSFSAMDACYYVMHFWLFVEFFVL